MVKWLLSKADHMIYRFLDKHLEDMPSRFVKAIAFYYTDARIRRKYWEKMNVYMDEGSYANPGMSVVAGGGAKSR